MSNREIVNVISPLLDSINIEDLESSVKNIFDKIPNSTEVKKINDVENYENKIVKKLNFEGLANFKYIESCCWLFNEIESMIKTMIHQKEKTTTNNYMIFNDTKYENHISILSLTTNPDINTSIRKLQKEWVDTGYILPFFFVKNIMKEKGYHIESFSNKTDPGKVTDIGYSNSDDYEEPVEIFDLVLKYETKNQLGKRRERSE